MAEGPATTSAPPPEMSGTEMGFAIFQKNCTSCHGNAAVERAPTPTQLREFPAERIYAALTTGVMKTAGDTLTDLERREVSESLAGRPLGAAASEVADKM